jgi:hypothetical protein
MAPVSSAPDVQDGEGVNKAFPKARVQEALLRQSEGGLPMD